MSRPGFKSLLAALAAAAACAAASAASAQRPAAGARASLTPSPAATPSPQASPTPTPGDEKGQDSSTQIILAVIGMVGTVVAAYFSGRAGGKQKASSVAEEKASAVVGDVVKELDRFKAGMFLVAGDDAHGQSFRNNLFNRLAMDTEARRRLADALTLIINDQGEVGNSFRHELSDSLMESEPGRTRLAKALRAVINDEEAGRRLMSDLSKRLVADELGKELVQSLLLIISANFRTNLRNLLSDESLVGQMAGKTPDAAAAPNVQHDLTEIKGQLHHLLSLTQFAPPGPGGSAPSREPSAGGGNGGAGSNPA